LAEANAEIGKAESGNPYKSNLDKDIDLLDCSWRVIPTSAEKPHFRDAPEPFSDKGSHSVARDRWGRDHVAIRRDGSKH
jgi:hypothetical protein